MCILEEKLKISLVNLFFMEYCADVPGKKRPGEKTTKVLSEPR
jgi:hypothetical protein